MVFGRVEEEVLGGFVADAAICAGDENNGLLRRHDWWWS